MPRRIAHVTLIVLAAGAATAVGLLPPIPQDPAYHGFADRRTVFGVPNAWNVLSNAGFLIVGWLGLHVLRADGRAAPVFAGVSGEQGRRAYSTLFVATLLTGFGSAYYHLAPDNARLVWDRLPMTIGFMALLTAILGERVSARAARALFVPLLALGAFSVAWWGWSEARGAGDLRLYGLVQFGSLAVVLLVLALYRAPPSGTRYLVAALATYGVAKLFEAFDAAVYATGQIVSGHSMKHVLAATAIALVALMLLDRAALARGSIRA